MWLKSLSAVVLEPKKIKSAVSIFSQSVCHGVMGPDAVILVFWMLSLIQLFHPPFSLSSPFSQFLFTLWHWDGIIYTSEVVDISPGNLIPACDSSSPAFHMMNSAYKLNKQGDNIQPWCTSFPILLKFHFYIIREIIVGYIKSWSFN